MLCLALLPGKYAGWGVCSTYLIKETSKLTETSVISSLDPQEQINGKLLDSKVFHTIGDHNLTRVMNVLGRENYGYTFFENILPDRAKSNATVFDIVFAGSTWCKERLEEKGIVWSEVLLQGIDPQVFYPISGEKPGAKDHFVIYSGGKFELRKGQDIAIRSVKVMQDRHKDVLFVNCWHNLWPFSMNTMAESTLIHYEPQKKWSLEYLRRLLHENGLDLNRTEILPLIPQDQFRKLYACTDIGLFPNRCEGGTNLVLMEYMACGKPVAASYNTGHKDILTESNALPLMKMSPFEFRETKHQITALWEEPDLDEVVEKLEYAYQHPSEVKELGIQSGEDLKKMTWAHTARSLVSRLGLLN